MAKGDNILRFAFGTPEVPGSAVWRISVLKRGDVYINNVPQLASNVHISLHASGKFHMKLGDAKYYNLEPPFVQQDSEFIHGPIIFFDTQLKNLPPLPPTGSVGKINWLGWPKDGHLFAVSTLYCRPKVKILPETHERVITGPLVVKLFHETKHLYVVLAERVQTQEERSNALDPYKNLEFEGTLPDAVELIRISKTFEGGPSAIVIDGFTTSVK